MKVFNLIEERGCDIEYCIFEGTYEECQKEIKKILLDQQAEDPRSSDAEFHNGNGQPFSWRIEDEDEKIIERHMALCFSN